MADVCLIPPFISGRNGGLPDRDPCLHFMCIVGMSRLILTLLSHRPLVIPLNSSRFTNLKSPPLFQSLQVLCSVIRQFLEESSYSLVHKALGEFTKAWRLALRWSLWQHLLDIRCMDDALSYLMSLYTIPVVTKFHINPWIIITALPAVALSKAIAPTESWFQGHSLNVHCANT